MAIRVLVATGLYPPEIGGPATHTRLMEEHLPSKGFMVTVVPFSLVRGLPSVIRHVAYFLRCVYKAFSHELMFAQDTVSVGFPARLAALVSLKPFVVRVPGDHVWEQGKHRFNVDTTLDEFPFWPHHPYLLFLRLIQLFVVRTATRVIVPSLYLKKIVMTWGVKESKIKVIYNGIDMPTPGVPSELPASPRIVSVGRLVPWKGFEGIIAATKNHPDWHLIIVGGGDEKEKLAKQVEDYDMKHRVTFTGPLPREQMLGWIKNADVFVLNSSYEGMPHTLIEAMTLGVSVVATDIPGNMEVASSESVVFVPSGDIAVLEKGILSSLTTSPENTLRKERARTRAADFSIEKTSDVLAKELHSLCAS